MAGPDARVVARAAVLVLPDTSKFLRSLERYLNRIESKVEMRVPVEVDERTLKRTLSQVKKFVDTAEPAKLKIGAEGTDAVKTGLESIERSSAKVAASVKGDWERALGSVSKASSKTLSALVGGAGFVAVGVAAASAVPQVLGFVAAIGEGAIAAGKLAIAAPAAFAVAGAAIAPLALGMEQFAKDSIPGSVKALETLKKVSADALAPAGKHIDKMVSRLMPSLTAGLSVVGASWAGVFINASKAITKQDELGRITPIFATAKKAVDGLSQAMKPLINGVFELIEGALPAFNGLGASIENAANKFNKWATAANESGKVLTWITEAKAAFKDFGRIASATGGILTGIFAPLTNGKITLSGIADQFERWDKWVNGPVGQGAISQVMSVVSDVAERLKSLMPDVVKAFEAWGPVLKRASEILGPLGTETLRSLINALEDLAPVADRALTIIEGFVSAVGGPENAGKILAFALIIGKIAAVITPAAKAVKLFGKALKPLGKAAGALSTAFKKIDWKGLGSNVGKVAKGFKSWGPSLLKVSGIGGVVIAMLSGMPNALRGIFSGDPELIRRGVRQMTDGLADIVGLPLQGIAWVFDKVFGTDIGGAVSKGREAVKNALFGIVETIGTALSPAGLANIGIALSQWWSTSVVPVFSAGAAMVGTALTNVKTTIQTKVSEWFTGIGTIISAGWLAVKTGFMNGVTSVLTTLAGFPLKVGTAIGNFGSMLSLKASTAWAAMRLAFTTGVTNALTAIAGFAGKVSAKIGDLTAPLRQKATAAWNTVRTNFTTGVSNALSAVAGFAGKVGSAMGDLLGTLRNKAVSAWNTLKTNFSNGVTNAVTVAKGLPGKAGSALSDLSSSLRKKATDAWNTVKANFSTGVTNAVTIARGLPGKAGSAISALAGNLRNKAVSAWNALKSAFSQGVSSAVSEARSLPGKVAGALSGLGGMLVGAGQSLINGFAQGIRNAAGSAVSAASGVVSSVRNLFPFSPAKEGPFSGKGYTRYSGEALIRDMAKGIQSEESTLKKAVSGVLGAARKTVDANALAASMQVETGVSRADMQTQMSAARAAARGQNGAPQINVYVNVDELEKVKKVGDFLALIDDRATARGYARSGLVDA